MTSIYKLCAMKLVIFNCYIEIHYMAMTVVYNSVLGTISFLFLGANNFCILLDHKYSPFWHMIRSIFINNGCHLARSPSDIPTHCYLAVGMRLRNTFFSLVYHSFINRFPEMTMDMHCKKELENWMQYLACYMSCSRHAS